MGDGNDHAELRDLTQPSKLPCTAECPLHDACTNTAVTAGSPDECFHHGLCFCGSASEDYIRGEAGIGEPQIVCEHAEWMSRIIGPARHADIDFGNSSMTVFCEEVREAVLDEVRRRMAPK